MFLLFFNEKATPQSLEISSVSQLAANGTNGGSDRKKMNNTSETFHLHTPTASQSSLVGPFVFLFSFLFFLLYYSSSFCYKVFVKPLKGRSDGTHSGCQQEVLEGHGTNSWHVSVSSEHWIKRFNWKWNIYLVYCLGDCNRDANVANKQQPGAVTALINIFI